MVFEQDEDLPGLGQHYCVTCAAHFIDESALRTHEKSRPHRRRYNLTKGCSQSINQF